MDSSNQRGIEYTLNKWSDRIGNSILRLQDYYSSGLALALQRGGKTVEASRKWHEFLEKHPQSLWREKAETHLEQLTSLKPGKN